MSIKDKVHAMYLIFWHGTTNIMLTFSSELSTWDSVQTIMGIIGVALMILSTYAGIYFLSEKELTEKESNLRINIIGTMAALSVMLLVIGLLIPFCD